MARRSPVPPPVDVLGLGDVGDVGGDLVEVGHELGRGGVVLLDDLVDVVDRAFDGLNGLAHVGHDHLIELIEGWVFAITLDELLDGLGDAAHA